MGIINAIKSALIYDKEYNKIKKCYPDLFNFLSEYDYEITNIHDIIIDANFLTDEYIILDSLNVRCDFRCEYGKVVKFIIVYTRTADLTTICNKFKTETNQNLFIPSEINEYQYIAISGWRDFKDESNRGYEVTVTFGFSKDWRVPEFRNHTIKKFRQNETTIKVFPTTSKESLIFHYQIFLYEVTSDLIHSINSYNKDPSEIYGWYLKKVHPNYKDKIPFIK